MYSNILLDRRSGLGIVSYRGLTEGIQIIADLTRTKSRELGPGPGLGYDHMYKYRGDFVEHQANGKIVIKDTDRNWELARQGYMKTYLLDKDFKDTALLDWWVFIHDIKKVSGKHRHQGGLALFIITGHGATEVNGEIIEWREGDCVMLPMDPRGLEHKHWNYGTEPAQWLAFVYLPFFDHVASELQQIEISPEFQARQNR